MFGILISTVIGVIEEENAFRELCNSMPPEQAEKARAERKVKIAADIQHLRNIEVAEAGRARNFWGN